MYFGSFPVIPYDSKGDLKFKDVTNLLRRVGIRTKLKSNKSFAKSSKCLLSSAFTEER